MAKPDFPEFHCYGKYSDNYGNHCLTFVSGPLQVWFSYKTMVAFKFDGHPRVVVKNQWGPTTGKHLNWIDHGDKAGRVDQETFDRLYADQSEEAFPEHPQSNPVSPFAVGALVS
jgi:hypothetical protein